MRWDNTPTARTLILKKETIMGNFFKKARTDTTTRYFTPDGDDYIDLRAELSKAEANQILSASPTGERDIEGGLAFFEHFFAKTIVGWSFVDEEEHPVPPTIENYRSLEASAARWIDEQLGTHLNKTLGAKVEELEGKSSD